MIKKLFLLTSILTISACASNESKQCDPEKNYIISNPEAMEEYKELRRTDQVKSFYYKSSSIKPCYYDSCVRFNPNDFDFIEVEFNDNKRKGIYTIITTKDLKDKNCMPKHPASIGRIDEFCFITIKNKNDVIKSNYQLSLADNGNIIIVEFKNINKNIELFKISYQNYATGALGGPGFGRCPISRINNPNYRFNSYTFHSENYKK